jgi:hypothetical protein
MPIAVCIGNGAVKSSLLLMFLFHQISSIRIAKLDQIVQNLCDAAEGAQNRKFLIEKLIKWRQIEQSVLE